MFFRVKQGGSPNAPHEYLQLVEGYRKDGRVKQRVVASLGRIDHLIENRSIDKLLKSLEKFSTHLKVIEKARLPEVDWCRAKSWGPVLVFERLWNEQHLPSLLGTRSEGRRFHFDLNRTCFALALQRLIAPGSDLSGSKWMDRIEGLEGIEPQHLYRTCRFLAAHKERIERELFFRDRTLFDTTVDLVFFDTTTTYFEGAGNELRRYGYSKDHRPDRVQIVVGVAMSRNGWPLACEIYPGNQVDLHTVQPLIALVKRRFDLGEIILVVDRGFVNTKSLKAFEAANLHYIVGTRLRKYREVRDTVLSRPGRYKAINDILKIKEAWVDDRRYIVCVNTEEAKKEAQDRAHILEALERKLAKHGPKSLVGNKGFARFLKIDSKRVAINYDKAQSEAHFDGKYVLRTNTDLPSDEAVTAYKSLWQVEQTFREMKSTLEVRPVYHHTNENMIGHVFGAFLGLRLKIALQKKLERKQLTVPWKDLIEDLDALKLIRIGLDGKSYRIRSDLEGVCHKVFQATGVRTPPRVFPA